jgi:hypothetical protein
MEPMFAATSFATTISLLADFVAHRGAKQGKSFEEFMAWLSEQRHDEIKSLLELNTTATIGIKALLGETQREILDRLRSLDESFATLAAGVEPYRGLAQAIHPTSVLSDQAVSVLQQFHDSGASKILEVEYQEGTKTLLIVDGPTSGELSVSDPRFLEDDLTTLVELGLLGQSHNDRGDRLLSFRRSAARFVENLVVQKNRSCTGQS